MKAANVNAIRTIHYPYGKGFYELCDELGMYVVDELPYCWTPTDDKEMEPAFTAAGARDDRARQEFRLRDPLGDRQREQGGPATSRSSPTW